MNDFANDIKKDGTLDDATIGNDLETHLYYTDTTAVLNNFKVKYRKLYNADTVNSVDMRFVKNFQNNTTYAKDKDLIEYPEIGSYGKLNILGIKSDQTLTLPSPSANYRSNDVECIIKNKGLVLRVEFYDGNGNRINTIPSGQGYNVNWSEVTDINGGYIKTTAIAIHKMIATFGSAAPNNRLTIKYFEKNNNTPTKIVNLTYSGW